MSGTPSESIERKLKMNLIIDQGDDMGPTSPRSCVDLRTGASGWLRVYKVTMVMLNYVSLGTLQAYENLIERVPSNPAAGSNGALRRRSREGRGRQSLGWLFPTRPSWKKNLFAKRSTGWEKR